MLTKTRIFVGYQLVLAYGDGHRCLPLIPLISGTGSQIGTIEIPCSKIPRSKIPRSMFGSKIPRSMFGSKIPRSKIPRSKIPRSMFGSNPLKISQKPSFFREIP